MVGEIFSYIDWKCVFLVLGLKTHDFRLYIIIFQYSLLHVEKNRVCVYVVTQSLFQYPLCDLDKTSRKLCFWWYNPMSNGNHRQLISVVNNELIIFNANTEALTLIINEHTMYLTWFINATLGILMHKEVIQNAPFFRPRSLVNYSTFIGFRTNYFIMLFVH